MKQIIRFVFVLVFAVLCSTASSQINRSHGNSPKATKSKQETRVKNKNASSKKQRGESTTTKPSGSQSTNDEKKNNIQETSVLESTSQLDSDILYICKNNQFSNEEKAWKLYDLGLQEIQLQTGNWEKVVSAALKGLEFATLSDTKLALFANLARGYGELREHDKAIDACRKGLLESPNDPELQHNMNVYYFNKGEYRVAENGFSRLIDMLKNTSKDYEKNLLSSSYYYLGRIQKMNYQLGSAEINLQKALELCTEQKGYVIQDAPCELGEIYQSQGKYEKAVEYFKRGIEINPSRFSNIKRLCQLGNCYMRLAQEKNNDEELMKEGLKSYFISFSKGQEYSDDMRKGVDLDDVSPGSLHDISNHYYMSAHYLATYMTATGGYAESLLLYKELLDVPQFKDLLTENDYVSIYAGYSIVGDTISANDILIEGYEKFPNNPDFMFINAFNEGYSMDAINLYKNILKKESTYKPVIFEYATVYNNIAWSYYLFGDYNQALPYAEKSIALNSTHGFSWDTLGEIQFKLGQYNKCIESMTKCIESEDAQARLSLLHDAYKYRGESYLKLGKQKEGNSDLEQAKRYQQ